MGRGAEIPTLKLNLPPGPRALPEEMHWQGGLVSVIEPLPSSCGTSKSLATSQALLARPALVPSLQPLAPSPPCLRRQCHTAASALQLASRSEELCPSTSILPRNTGAQTNLLLGLFWTLLAAGACWRCYEAWQ